MNSIVSRPYNSLTIKGDIVVKTCPHQRVTLETEWFKHVNKMFPQNIPEINNITEVSYEMNYIEGDNIYQYYTNKNNTPDIINNILKLATKLHTYKFTPLEEQMNKDIEQMYFNKPLQGIKLLLENHDMNHIKINGVSVSTADEYLTKLYVKYKTALYEKEYCLIHGDFTASNILYNKGNLLMIDPRGNFGDTLFYGDYKYDFAKLYYSFFGSFDKYNNKLFTLNINGNDYEFEVKPLIAKEYLPIFLKYISFDKKLLEYIHATIWLSLTSHVGSEDQKVVAYLKGTSILQELCEDSQ